MNSFGRLFRVHIFGESHGESVGILIDGCPAGLPLDIADFLEDIERRKGGLQKGTTPRKEDDYLFLSRVFLMVKQLGLLSPFYLRITIPEVATMKNKEPFQGPDMPTLLLM